MMVEDNNINSRQIVLNYLLEVETNKRFSHVVLNKIYSLDISQRDKRFIIKVFKGTVSNKIKLDYIINLYSKIKVDKMRPQIRCILRMSVYQIIFLYGIKDYAVINDAVNLVKDRGLYNLSGFVNGVLRNISRNKNKINFPDKESDYKYWLSINYSMPIWIIDFLEKEYKEQYIEKILRYYNKEPSLVIRVNKNIIPTNRYTNLLNELNIKYLQDKDKPDSIRIEEYISISKLPLYDMGAFVIQDSSSQIAVDIAPVKNNISVLDLCASPGGKSIQLYDKLMCGYDENLDIEFYSCDKSEDKLDILKENIKRTGFNKIKTVVNDATRFNPEYKEKFDILLLDLPCSGLGVLSRKSDQRYNVSLEMLSDLVDYQKLIIDNAIKYVKKGGYLIYSTCTINHEENQKQTEYICNTYNFEIEPTSKEILEKYNQSEVRNVLKNSNLSDGEILIIPGILDMNGSYAALLKKV